MLELNWTWHAHLARGPTGGTPVPLFKLAHYVAIDRHHCSSTSALNESGVITSTGNGPAARWFAPSGVNTAAPTRNPSLSNEPWAANMASCHSRTGGLNPRFGRFITQSG